MVGPDEEPWFVASDVAKVLGYNDLDQAIRKHCKMTKSYPVESTGQVRYLKIIPESDVYRLIMRSKMPQAENFQDWVTTDILLSIHKQGGYAIENPIKQGETPDPKAVPEGSRLFESEQFWTVRVVVGPDGEPWFVAKDVAEVLGYGDTAQAIRKHCRGGGKIPPPLKKRNARVQNHLRKRRLSPHHAVQDAPGRRLPGLVSSEADHPHPSANSEDRLTTPH